MFETRSLTEDIELSNYIPNPGFKQVGSLRWIVQVE